MIKSQPWTFPFSTKWSFFFIFGLSLLVFSLLFLEIIIFPLPKKTFRAETDIWCITSCSISEIKKIAVGYKDGKVSLWDFDLGQEACFFQAHTDGVCSLAFSSNSKLLATGDVNNKVKIWNLETSQEQLTFTGKKLK